MRNSMIRYSRWLSLVMVSASLTATNGWAAKGQPGRGGDFEDHGPGAMMLPEQALDRLNLTPQQRDQIKKIREENKSDFMKKHDEVQKLRNELHDKMAGTASDDDLKNSFNNLQSKMDDLRKQGFERMLKIRAVLTPEQRKEMSQLVKERRGKFGRHHGRPGMSGGQDNQ